MNKQRKEEKRSEEKWSEHKKSQYTTKTSQVVG